MTDKESCDALAVACAAPKGSVRDVLASWDEERAATLAANRRANTFRWSKVGELAAAPITGIGGSVGFTSFLGLSLPSIGVDLPKLLSVPGPALFVSAATLLCVVSAVFRKADDAVHEASLVADKRRALDKLPGFFADPKVEWPLRAGASVIGLSEEQAALERRAAKEEAMRAWRQLPEHWARRMRPMDAESFLTWCSRQSAEGKALAFEQWRGRATATVADQVAFLSKEPLRAVQLAAVRSNGIGVGPVRIPGGMGPIRAWRESQRLELEQMASHGKAVKL